MVLEYFKKLWPNQLKAAILVVPVALIVFIWLWPSYLGLALAAFASLVVFWVFLLTGEDDFRHSFEGLAAILSCVALVMAGYWFFVERRSIPKLNIQPQITIWSIGGGKAFARVELLLENVGTTDIAIRPGDDVRVEIGQVLPLAGRQADTMLEAYQPIEESRKPLGIIKTDKYPLRARLDNRFDLGPRDDGLQNDQFDLTIEAGETERRYFKAVIPCETGLVSSVRFEVPKKLDRLQMLFEDDKRQMYWRAQAVSNMIETCE